MPITPKIQLDRKSLAVIELRDIYKHTHTNTHKIDSGTLTLQMHNGPRHQSKFPHSIIMIICAIPFGTIADFIFAALMQQRRCASVYGFHVLFLWLLVLVIFFFFVPNGSFQLHNHTKYALKTWTTLLLIAISHTHTIEQTNRKYNSDLIKN